METVEGSVGDLVKGIVDDLKTIARDEATLTKQEIKIALVKSGADVAAIMLAGFVALIGLGLLCVSAVVALDAVIDSLALRLILMAAIYLIVGGVVAAVFARRLKGDIKPDMTIPKYELKSTIANAREAIRHA